ncbi:MAG: phosphopentomutase [Melioribacteraceae bacterium]|nr:phosphopentomutase [Melioribacteraceae bacterium]MCF8354695.1 phosphopentomutase [Melioribacteraceae bacterium]MCF8393597.1 phosphopentomutase [Melioribacteraceae bacterium]MCF8419407.1 phosphopentomutase [Melioribacteraceae bacterium]
MNNFIVIVLDGVGVGELPDANKFGDSGSNTLGNMAEKLNGLNLPNLQKFGLGNIIPIKGVEPASDPQASFGKMTEVSTGKDSTTGHWELGGLKIDFDFPYYPNGFPEDVMNMFLQKNNLEGYLANKPASGTEIIEELGDEHVQTGYPIVYTSADSVFQIAAHEEIIPLDRLYKICEVTRNEILINEHAVGRVIARPFIGTHGNYSRTTNRKDFSIDPPQKTIIEILSGNGINTIAIGKINDLFNYRGINNQLKTKTNSEGIKKIIESIESNNHSYIMANLVDFDVYYGHRNDPVGFHKALQEFDNKLPEIIESMDKSDALILTADHGNDPTTPSTDHSREYVPLLYYSKNRSGKNLGTRKTFSDVAQTAAHFFKVNNALEGESFLNA